MNQGKERKKRQSDSERERDGEMKRRVCVQAGVRSSARSKVSKSKSRIVDNKEFKLCMRRRGLRETAVINNFIKHEIIRVKKNADHY